MSVSKIKKLQVDAITSDDVEEISVEKPLVYPTEIIEFEEYQLVPKWFVENFLNSLIVNPNRIVSGLEYSLLDDDIIITAGEWIINQSEFSKETSTTFNDIAFAAAGLQRFILIYANNDDEILKVEGTEAAIAEEPSLPDNSLLLYTILVNDAGIGDPQANLTAYQLKTDKDSANGYVGLTDRQINFYNALGTIKSFLANAATAARTYTFPDKSGTVAMLDDVSGGGTFADLTDDPYDNDLLSDALNEKVDVVSGKQLSTEDYTTAEKAKLSGIATGATANDTDANLKNRANHTGTQTASTISDFNAAAIAAPLSSYTKPSTPSTVANAMSLQDAIGNLDRKAEIEPIGVPMSNTDTDITAGTKKTEYFPFNITVYGNAAKLTTAPVGSTFIMDVKVAGVSMFTTKPSIDSGENTTNTAAVTSVMTSTPFTIPAFTKIEFIVDSPGAVTAGKELTYYFIGYRTF